VAATLHVTNPAWERWLRANRLPGAALFGSRTAAEVLGLLTMHPGRAFGVRDIVFQLGTNLESTQRAVTRLLTAHVVSGVRDGRRRDVLMEPGPQAMALRQLALGTVTLAPRLRWAGEDLGAGAVTAAVVHGSVASATEGLDSDVDVIVVGEASIPDLAPYLADLEHLMGRPVNPLAYTVDAYRAGIAVKTGYLRRVLDRPRLLIGVGDDWLTRAEADACTRTPSSPARTTALTTPASSPPPRWSRRAASGHETLPDRPRARQVRMVGCPGRTDVRAGEGCRSGARAAHAGWRRRPRCWR
jgi:predicted nucleotidyltransferase